MFVVAYNRPSSGIDTGRLLRKACASKGLSMKEAAIWMSGKPTYEATLSRAVADQGPLDAHGLANLPLPVLFKFFRLLIAAKLKSWETDVVADVKRSA